MEAEESVTRFTLGGLLFEYDSEKNRENIEKHGISLKSAARVFLTMTVLNFTMRVTVVMRIAAIR